MIMIDEIINNPDLNKYLNPFEAGQTIFLEGDDSEDLFILVSGQVDVIKGKEKIAEFTEKGTLFGEMSFLLRARRTATVKARGEVKAIRIPKEEITMFLNEFPTVSREIMKLLAQRLEVTSQILYGLKEFSNQLPDAVILTDREGKILTWNSAAEHLYGRYWDQMRYKPVEEIYEDPQDYKGFIEEVQSKYAVKEKTLKIRHPEKGTRFISTSTTILYDGHHNFQGVLSLGRDVTAVKTLEKRYRRSRYWFIPALILVGLLATALFYGYPYFSKGQQSMDIRKQELRNQLAKDYIFFKAMLVDLFVSNNREKTDQLLKDFFDIQESTTISYTGLVLLDKEKGVLNTYSIKADTDSKEMEGSSYAGIEFKGSEKSLHKILILYRADKENPMGRKGIEIAFEMNIDNPFLGWLIFQMDMDLLEEEYGVNEEDLKEFIFQRP